MSIISLEATLTNSNSSFFALLSFRNINNIVKKRRTPFYINDDMTSKGDTIIDLYYKVFNLYDKLSDVDKSLVNVERIAEQELDSYGILSTNINPIYTDGTRNDYVGEWYGLDPLITGNALISNPYTQTIKSEKIYSGDRRFISNDTTDNFFKNNKGKFAIYLGAE